MKRVRAIHSTGAASVWPQALPFVERAMAHDNGRVSGDDLLDKIQARDMQLWLGEDDGDLQMVAITQVCDWPQMKVARFVVLAGEDFDGWWTFARPTFDRWAAREGCAQYEVRGRLAWLRKLKDWTFDCVVMRAEVAHG